MVMKTAEVIEDLSKYPIVHMPGRKFPGVVVQGDTLNEWVKMLDEALMVSDLRKMRDEIEYVRDMLSGARGVYERVCVKNIGKLPY
jgi:hypothetical protein